MAVKKDAGYICGCDSLLTSLPLHYWHNTKIFNNALKAKSHILNYQHVCNMVSKHPHC